MTSHLTYRCCSSILSTNSAQKSIAQRTFSVFQTETIRAKPIPYSLVYLTYAHLHLRAASLAALYFRVCGVGCLDEIQAVYSRAGGFDKGVFVIRGGCWLHRGRRRRWRLFGLRFRIRRRQGRGQGRKAQGRRICSCWQYSDGAGRCQTSTACPASRGTGPGVGIWTAWTLESLPWTDSRIGQRGRSGNGAGI